MFVAAPLRGTVLADTEHGIKMLDRYTNLFTELPDNPFTISMEAIFMMTKLVYHGAVKALPGLRSMYPPGEYLLQLNKNPNHTTEYYALAADFKPQAEESARTLRLGRRRCCRRWHLRRGERRCRADHR